MKLHPWMYLAAGLAALMFLSRKKSAMPPGVEELNHKQAQNLFIDP